MLRLYNTCYYKLLHTLFSGACHRKIRIIGLSRFYTKNILYCFLFNHFGYYRQLIAYKKSDYGYEEYKQGVRKKHYGKEGWQKEKKNGILYRDYSNYDEYVSHQKVKLDEMIAFKGGFSNRDIIEYRLKFFKRFHKIPQYLPWNASILCLGARQGTEVEVLRDLGFIAARGIDLNPGPDNPWVKPGDFMAIAEPDHSLDMIYSNAVDHAFDLESFFKESARVVKLEGYAMYDLSVQTTAQGGGPFEAVEWDSEEKVFHLMLKYFKQVIHVETETAWKVVLLKGPITGQT